jgi:hypothetical protein
VEDFCMNKITSKNVTTEHIEKVNHVLGIKDGEKVLSNYGYAFYYNHMFNHKNENNLDLCDVDRYANLNTILGYDVGITKFRSLDGWLWEHGYDLMELCGSDEDKELLQRATRERKRKTKDLDYSKWRNFVDCKYTYSYFENGKEFK